MNGWINKWEWIDEETSTHQVVRTRTTVLGIRILWKGLLSIVLDLHERWCKQLPFDFLPLGLNAGIMAVGVLERFRYTYTCTWNVKGQRSSIVMSSLCLNLLEGWLLTSRTRLLLNVKTPPFTYGLRESLLDPLVNMNSANWCQYVTKALGNPLLYFFNCYPEWTSNYYHCKKDVLNQIAQHSNRRTWKPDWQCVLSSCNH